MQLEDYLGRDDRIVLPLGSTEQHAYLSLETDNIIAERIAEEAAEPLGIPVLPVLAYGITPGFGAFPGSPTLRLETLAAVIRDILESLYGQGFRRFLIANAHGGNPPGAVAAAEWRCTHEDAHVLWHDSGRADRTSSPPRSIQTSTMPPGRRTFPGHACRASSCRASGSRRSNGPSASGGRRPGEKRWATAPSAGCTNDRTRMGSASGPRLSSSCVNGSSPAGPNRAEAGSPSRRGRTSGARR